MSVIKIKYVYMHRHVTLTPPLHSLNCLPKYYTMSEELILVCVCVCVCVGGWVWLFAVVLCLLYSVNFFLVLFVVSWLHMLDYYYSDLF